MKKIITALFILISLFLANPVVAAAEAPLRVLASTFPVYLFTRNVCAGAQNVQTELLIPAAVGCPHDFALKPADLQKLASASVLVINGHDLEEFLEKMLQNPHPGLTVITAGEGIVALPAAVSSHGHEHGNPHIFAAPEEAAKMILNIASTLSGVDPANANIYRENAQNLSTLLNGLSDRFKMIGQKAGNKKVVISHDGLAYLMNNANLEVTAILENSDSLARLTALKKDFQNNRPALIAGDAQYPDKLAIALARETDIPFVKLDTCARGPQDPPLDYYQQVMENNLKSLEKYFE